MSFQSIILHHNPTLKASLTHLLATSTAYLSLSEDLLWANITSHEGAITVTSSISTYIVFKVNSVTTVTHSLKQP